MQTRKFKSVFVTFLVALLFTALLAVTASAELTVSNGNVVGLDTSATYQYAFVTAANYTSPTYSSVPAGSTSIDGLETGIWLIKNTTADTTEVVWVPGNEDDRNDIGSVSYNEKYGKEVVLTSDSTDFVVGSWSGTQAKNHSTFATYYLSATGSHIAPDVAVKYLNGTTSRVTVRSAFQKVVFKYAYSPEEILPVEDLYTLNFKVGSRQGSFIENYSEDASDPNMKTKYVLYTIDKTGTVTTHEALLNVALTATNCSTTHSLNVPVDFPNATGWVIGLDIYPYGSVPLDGLDFEIQLAADGVSGVTTCFFVEYLPTGYTTRYNTGISEIPSQPNGANTAYIQGYGDGTFKPDGDITIAEAATIIAKVDLVSNEIPSGRISKFADCTVDEWYNDAVTYIESLGGFDYVTGSMLYPNNPITRGEFVQIIYSLANLKSIQTSSFKDVDSDNAFYSAIATLSDRGVINGYADGTFRPDATITRAEAVTVINRMINLVADDKTVAKDSITNTFSDISGHWAENQVLMASNDNVKSISHMNASAAGITQTETAIIIDTDHTTITIDNKSGKVLSIINKYDGTDVFKSTSTPWFTYLVMNTGLNFYPKSLDIVDNRIKVSYVDGTEVYLIVDVNGGYFTVEIDSQLPAEVHHIIFSNLIVSSEFSDDCDSFRLSAVTMNINTQVSSTSDITSSYMPGGSSKCAIASAMTKFGTVGAKVGIVFSKFEDDGNETHRNYLKSIMDNIDPTVGITSTHGGAYTNDNLDVFGDYVIQSGSLTSSNADATGAILDKYSVDQLDIHQGGGTFIQGNFNFVCAKVTGETFTTAAQFKERIGDKVTSYGVQLGLHTYSSLISSVATDILSDPKWQQDLAYEKDAVLTLSSDVTSSDTAFLTNESAANITIRGQTSSGGSSALPWSGPYTGYFLIDEEIVLVDAVAETGLTTVARGKMGTTAAAHSAGAEIRHLLGHYSMFQPQPGSDLFLHIADNIAEAYNDGGFEMIYLDGLESFARNGISEETDRWYYFAQFIHRVVSGCEVEPIIEGSAIPNAFWNARARAGAIDCARRSIKAYNLHHAQNNQKYLNSYMTATLGWFEYSPDRTQLYKNTRIKTIFRDDIEYMGAIGIAFDMSMSMNSFNYSLFSTTNTLSNNALYSTLFSKLRKAEYFSKNVRSTLKEGLNAGKEYKMFEQEDGSWAFREALYVKNKVFDMNDDLYTTGSANNPFSAQVPYIRIEQRYSTLGEDELVLYTFDSTADVTEAKNLFDSVKDITDYFAFKINVYGNGDPNGALLLTLKSSTTSEAGRLDFFVPTSHTGWREFIFVEADNADYSGYTFSGGGITSTNYETYRNNLHTTTVNSVTVDFAEGASYTGVKLDTLSAYTVTNSPVSNPSVTINGETMTFSTTLRSGEYIEYLPELNKAYKHSYDTSGEGNGNTATVSEISFTGSVTVPSGDFTYTYDATSTLWYDIPPIRAQVVIGLLGDDIIANEAGYNATLPDIDPDILYSTLN